MRLPLSCAALLAVAAPIAAQSNAERVVNDAYSRSHDYDLVHQRIEVRNFDWDSTSLDGRVTTTLVALRPGLDSVILDAGKRLVVSRVVDARGTSLRGTAHGDTLVVYRSEEHTSELQSHSDLHSFPTRRSSDLWCINVSRSGTSTGTRPRSTAA